MDIIKTQAIQAGIKFIMSLLTPSGAFVKAAMMIIDLVKFFVQKAAQIMELVKAFTDGIKAIASGNVGAVAKAIESALGRAIPVVIGFLASLAGLGGLTDKVVGVIHKIRQRIKNAIVKFWNFVKGKAKGLLRKIGFGDKKGKTKDIEKDNTKDWDDVRVPFEGEDKHTHTLYFDSKDGNTVLMVASTPKTFSDFIADIRIEDKDERTQKAKNNAIRIANGIDARKKDRTNDDKDKEEKKKHDIASMTKALSKFVAILFGIDKQGGLPESEIKHSSKSTSGGVLGSYMVAKMLTQKGINGSEPKETNKIYEDLSYRMYGNGSYYVRGHLLNEHMHGEGILINLTPLSQQGNKNHLRVAEEPIKIAVLGGAIVEYTLLVKYGQSIPEVSDTELEQAGFESDEDKEKVRKIRKAEQHVPKGLTLRSNYLKKEGDKYVKDKLLVINNSVLNPVDFDIKSYQINKVKKEKVSILHSSAEDIIKNTNLDSEERVQVIKKAAEKVTNLYTYEQILEQISNAGILLKEDLEKLQKAKNVTLK